MNFFTWQESFLIVNFLMAKVVVQICFYTGSWADRHFISETALVFIIVLSGKVFGRSAFCKMVVTFFGANKLKEMQIG